MLVIRPTEIEDAPHVAVCVDRVARERRFLARTEGFPTEQTQAYIQFLKGCGGVHLVALDDNDIVGWCDITPGTFEGLTHVGHLGMGLLSNYRGQGWGKTLLSSALQTAFRGHLERVELEVFSSNVYAIKLYRAAGFREEGRKRNARKLEGQYDDIIIFGLLREEWQG